MGGASGKELAIAGDAGGTNSSGNASGPSLNPGISTVEENERKRKLYAHLKSEAASRRQQQQGALQNEKGEPPFKAINVIEEVYNSDFDTIDHTQAVRFPPMVERQIKEAVRAECERRCAEMEKTMARCLQDKMWTSWKCQKERDAYYHCVADEEKKNLTHNPNDGSYVDLLTAYRWKYNLGVFHGDIVGRNNIMKRLWKEHFPERDLPHPWVKD